jgi:hypothetical protein
MFCVGLEQYFEVMKTVIILLISLPSLLANAQFGDNVTTGNFRTFVKHVLLNCDMNKYKTVEIVCEKLNQELNQEKYRDTVLIFCFLNSDSTVECIEIADDPSHSKIYKESYKKVGTDLLPISYFLKPRTDSVIEKTENGLKTVNFYSTWQESTETFKLVLYPEFNLELHYRNGFRTDSSIYHRNGSYSLFHRSMHKGFLCKSKSRMGIWYHQTNSTLDTTFDKNSNRIITETFTRLQIDSACKRPAIDKWENSHTFQCEYYSNGLLKSVNETNGMSSMVVSYYEERKKEIYKYVSILRED